MMNYIEKDLKCVWHPFTQPMVDQPPINIVRAKDTILFSDDGKEYIDAISSWWVNLHGHSHPDIARALQEQFLALDHVIFAGFTHPAAINFAEELLDILPGNMAKLFYSDNGSTSIEVAIKMALQYYYNQGIKKQTIVAFHHSYHGDTFGSMSVSERGAFNQPFNDLLFHVEFITSPSENAKAAEEELRKLISKGNVTAMIYEPLIQGAGGMLMYEPSDLDPLIALCKSQGILTIADEVMTGFGRTGKFFASEYMQNTPDIICLSKGITGGVLPLGATVCTQKIYDAFLSDDRSKTFFHGHSYTGNALSVAAARASLNLLKKTLSNIQFIEANHRRFSQSLKSCKNVKNIRCRGTILAFDVLNEQKTSYFNSIRDHLYREFLKKNILTRPLGNTVYFLPPYCITQDELNHIYTSTLDIVSHI